MNMSNYTQHLKSKKNMYTLQLGTMYTNHNSFSPGGYIPLFLGERARARGGALFG
jgi:hypothetical protein